MLTGYSHQRKKSAQRIYGSATSSNSSHTSLTKAVLGSDLGDFETSSEHLLYCIVIRNGNVKSCHADLFYFHRF